MGELAEQAAAAALAGKYRAIQRLRALHAAGDPADPRPALRALAREFPSALRELDLLPMAVIEGRLAELEGAARGDGPLPEWARLQVAVHAWLRVALRAKAIAGRTRNHARAREESLASPEGVGLGVDDEDLAAILAPPGGRLLPWVHRRVARAFGTTRECVEAAFAAR